MNGLSLISGPILQNEQDPNWEVTSRVNTLKEFGRRQILMRALNQASTHNNRNLIKRLTESLLNMCSSIYYDAFNLFLGDRNLIVRV